MKRAVCSLLALLILLGVAFGAVSCASGGEDEPKKEVPAFNLVENGEAKISIVYQSPTNTCVEEAISILRDAVSGVCGAEVEATIDPFHDRAEDKAEVLIGNTKYAASGDALGALDANSYSVSVSGNKIVIVANNPYLYPIAAKKLVEALSAGEGTLSLAGDYSFKSESYPAISLGTKGKTDYTLIYAKGDKMSMDMATRVKVALNDAGIQIGMKDDSTSSTGLEIVVGKTKRAVSVQNLFGVYNSACIAHDNKGNIAITGNLEYATELFSSYIYVLGGAGNGVNMIEDMFGLFAPIGAGSAPTYLGGGKVEVFCSFMQSKSYYIIVHDATKYDFNQYTEQLKGEGYTCYRECEVNGNKFATWTDGYNILTMSHISYTDPKTIDMKTASLGAVKYMSIAVDCVENSSLPIVEPEIEDITTEQLTTIGTQCAYLLRLSDGRFVIFDSGMPDAADEIYKLLCEQNVREGKPTVAAWFLTHGHIDHIGALNSFVDRYSGKVEIQSFVHNLPAYELYNGKNTVEKNPDVESAGLLERSTQYYNSVPKRYPDAKIIIAHAGQSFVFGDITIDVLFTSENIYGKQMLDTNMSSVVYSITGKTGRMIILGDAVDIECPMLNAIYGSTLKANVVQVAHHGYNGGNAEMYASIGADYAIWANSYDAVLENALHIQSKNKRNKFDYKTVKCNIIPSGGAPIILSENMTKNDVMDLDVGLTG